MTTRSYIGARWHGWAIALAAGIAIATILSQLADLQHSTFAGSGTHRVLVVCMVAAALVLVSTATLRDARSRTEHTVQAGLFSISAFVTFYFLALIS